MEMSEEERNAIAAEIRAVEAAVAGDRLPANGSRELLPNVEGFFSDAEGVALARVCKGRNVLEVGSWKGRSTVFAALGGAKRIVAVDTWEGDHYTGRGNFWPEFRTNVGRYCAVDRVVPVVSRFEHVQRHFDLMSFGVLHYDADHDSEPTRAALVEFVMRSIPDAFVLCHDANYSNVRTIVDNVALAWDRDVFVVDRLAVMVPRLNVARVIDARAWLEQYAIK